MSGGPPGDVTFVAAVLYTDTTIALAVGIAQIVEKNNPTLPGATCCDSDSVPGIAIGEPILAVLSSWSLPPS